jgi:hypothetical protein
MSIGHVGSVRVDEGEERPYRRGSDPIAGRVHDSLGRDIVGMGEDLERLEPLGEAVPRVQVAAGRERAVR